MTCPNCNHATTAATCPECGSIVAARSVPVGGGRMWHGPGPNELRESEAKERKPRRGIYAASRASVPERGVMWRRLRSQGVPIISSWIDEDGEGETGDLGELWARIAREVMSAERLILYVEPSDFPLKGALVEVGMAIAAGVPVTCVLPGVTLEERSCRPVGSWMRHPLVSVADTIDDACRKAREERAAVYPCARCGKPRTKAEGGTTFTVCDACWVQP
jgi:hypothetical protein